jgi:outer membrane protein assembly factor BamB
VVSLTSSGNERWVYRYNGPGNGWDQAHSVVAGSDGNLYIAGRTEGIGTLADFTVVSLTDSGAERWIYRYSAPGDSSDEAAYSITMGLDGNIYTAGWIYGSGTYSDLAVVSLTESGTERWVYQYDGPGNESDHAYSVIMGSDGNLYAAGDSKGSGTSLDITILSLTDTGIERWVYRYNGPADGFDQSYSVAMGPDSNLYAAGTSGGTSDLTVVSLANTGSERWVYRYDGPANGGDLAYSIAADSDGSIYAAGWSWGGGTGFDFTVASLTDSGSERWVYRYDGPANENDYAESIIIGSDGNVYAAGQSRGSGTSQDLTVVSLTPLGGERWVYRYDSPRNSDDCANFITVGSDGNMYAAGSSYGIGTYADLIAVSLSPDVGVEEGPIKPCLSDFGLAQNSPNPFHHSTRISYSLPQVSEVTLNIHDISGRLVKTLVSETQQPGMHQVRWNRNTNPSGVYFYRLRASEFMDTGKMVVVE